MRKTAITIITVANVVLMIVVSSVNAQRTIGLKIGMNWPQAILEGTNNLKLCGESGLDAGMIIDKRVALGFAGDFQWNVSSKEKDSALANGTSQAVVTSDEKTFMFPVGGFIEVDPMPGWIVHPSARCQVGYNSMVYSFKPKDGGDTARYYFGLFVKAGINASYNLGEMSSFFVGADYQWANTRTGETDFFRRDMSGIGIHAGFRVIY